MTGMLVKLVQSPVKIILFDVQSPKRNHPPMVTRQNTSDPGHGATYHIGLMRCDPLQGCGDTVHIVGSWHQELRVKRYE
jgi:hypothetical protein